MTCKISIFWNHWLVHIALSSCIDPGSPDSFQVSTGHILLPITVNWKSEFQIMFHNAHIWLKYEAYAPKRYLTKGNLLPLITWVNYHFLFVLCEIQSELPVALKNIHRQIIYLFHTTAIFSFISSGLFRKHFPSSRTFKQMGFFKTLSQTVHNPTIVLEKSFFATYRFWFSSTTNLIRLLNTQRARKWMNVSRLSNH